jgi:hypothetical protein
MSHLDGRGGRAVPRQVLRTRVRPSTHLKWMYGITPKIVALVTCLIALTLVATGVLFAELRNASDRYSTAVTDELPSAATNQPSSNRSTNGRTYCSAGRTRRT